MKKSLNSWAGDAVMLTFAGCVITLLVSATVTVVRWLVW